MALLIVAYAYIREQDHGSSPGVICPRSSARLQKHKAGGELLQHSQQTVTC